MPKVGQSLLALNPYWQTNDRHLVRLYLGHVTDVLRRMPEKSVHMVVTSPPYWGLRDYKTGSEHELGSEQTPQEYVARMVEVFREVRRVLRDDGTLWLNLGDSYYNGGLAGVPWRVALALQEDGWVLRQDIIWAKTSPMPESVKNRCTKAHEYVFLLTKKGSGYYCDMEAIKEQGTAGRKITTEKSLSSHLTAGAGVNPSGNGVLGKEWNWGAMSNKRDVWTVSSQGYDGAHFATYPPKLIEPMIKAGTSEKGCCSKCEAPWKRIVEERQLKRDRPNDYVKRTGEAGTGNSCANSVAGVDVKTVGWEPTCECASGVIPCTVLDPFIGSGTTCEVAIGLGRRSVGIDLSQTYLDNNAIPRISGALLSRPRFASLIPRDNEAARVNLGEDSDTEEIDL